MSLGGWGDGLGKMLSKGAFNVGYALYKTRIGHQFHAAACSDGSAAPHSVQSDIPLIPGVHITVVPMLADNYCYLLVDSATKKCLAVDPADAAAVLAAVEAEGLDLLGILTTHTHWDHSGGNEAIKQKLPGVKVYGGKLESIPGLTDAVGEGDTFLFPPRAGGAEPKIVVQVWEAPCHTVGHVMYVVNTQQKTPDGGEGALQPLCLFTGDTVFQGGTGKFFEGTPEQMGLNLVRVSKLPADTKICCGHEYTVNNYKYAHAIEPDNTAVRERVDWAIEQRRQGKSTCPSTVGDEMSLNPYMRVMTSKTACGKLSLCLHKLTGDARLKDGKAEASLVLGELRRVRDDNLVKAAMDSYAPAAARS